MPLFIALMPLILWLMFIVGWISNVVWTFHQTEAVSLILGILGAIVAPIGAVHGLLVLF